MKAVGFGFYIDKSGAAIGNTQSEYFQNRGLQVAYKKQNCIVFTTENLSGNFVNFAATDDWLICAIGSIYNGKEASKALQSSLKESQNDPNAAINCVQTMYGQYCLVAYHIQSQTVLMATDPSGVRSLFTFESATTTVVSSGIPIMRQVSLFDTNSPDLENQSFLFRYGFNLPSHTPIRDVKEISPKKLQLTSAYELENITDFNPAQPIQIGTESLQLPELMGRDFESSYEEELLGYLFGACRQQLGSASRVGVLLGGFDSALVASLLHKLDVEVETYSFHYENQKYNQPYADELADALGIKHHWVPITPAVIEFGLKNFANTANWPVLWLNYVIQTQHVCSLMADNGIEVCFSGDGCDTVFLGYPSTHRRGALYKKVPKLTPKVARVGKDLIHLSRLETIFGHIARVALSLIDASQYPPDERAAYSFQLFDDKNYRRITKRLPENYPSHQTHFEKFMRDTENLEYERKVYLAKSFISPNRCKIVSSADTSGFAVHSPYMHPAVANFARTLPVEYLRPTDENEASREGKYLLMKAADNAKLLPKEIIFQRKLAAISSPIDQWLSDSLNNFAKEHLQNLPFEADERYISQLLSEKIPEKLYKNNFSGDGVVGLAASLLLTYAAFFE